MTRWRDNGTWVFGLFLVAITLIAYGPAWRAGFIWDDDAYLTQNPLLTAPDGLRRIWFSLDSPSQYFPLTYTAFYVERALWGLNPVGYHLVNLLLHAANALLVWRLLARLRVPGAWLAAAIFALHPVQVESVAWITERKNVLMGFFFLLTLWAWVRFLDEGTGRRWRYYVLALVFYALSLFAKTTACTLPAALLLILWLKKMPVNWRRLAQVAPFAAMGLVLGLVTVWWEHHHQGTEDRLFSMRPMESVLLASRAVWFYAGKLLWPANLTFSYPRWNIEASDPRAYGWLLATLALAWVIWRAREWTGRSVEVAAAFFAVTLSPLLGFIMIYTFQYTFVADHYQYLACIGPIALAAAGMTVGLARIAAGKPFLQPALCVALLMTLGALTWKQCGMYANAETLWQATLARNPGSWLAHNNLGTILRQQGKVDEAITQYQEALQIEPDNESIHFNLARAFYQEGRVDLAIGQFQSALQIEPGDMEAQNNLAWLLATAPQASLRNGAKAVELARQANELAGGKNPVILGTLAAALAETGRFSEALEAARRASQLSGAQSNTALAGQLQFEMKLFQAGRPYHIAEQTR
ncbi:MAG: tetratricopeptide repeat protein [Verrucomicrobiota bacterium]